MSDKPDYYSDRLLSALVAFAEGEAYCPCCEGVRECLPECTIEADCKSAGGNAWNQYERMMAARDALNTDNSKRAKAHKLETKDNQK